jgi:hypothetical protein
MLKLFAGTFAPAVLAAALLISPTPAQAGTEYPWCAVYSESTVGATNCGFVTLAQCRAAISGAGGGCYQNPAYTAASPQPKRHPNRR